MRPLKIFFGQQLAHLPVWRTGSQTKQYKTVTFCWGKTEQRQAGIVAIRAYSFIRFHWLDDENERDYFEIKMSYNELTGDYVLEITDFSEADEADDLKELWDSQVSKLRRTCGFQLTFDQKFFALLFLC